MEGIIEQHIESTPGVRSGRPRIVGTRLAAIDEDIARDRAYAEAARVSHPSLLRERLESAMGSQQLQEFFEVVR
jgi:hypothetical protein